ncbi:MAG: pyrroline-5-carboxylate reductase [Desulfovibrio sp.]|jgi:pyrroline-5-carboxylate reductase|nr:pyrroline-5-carboxylate reductase [Desulfovibrio sp.]
MRYGFIGLGNMASAIIRGMIASDRFRPRQIQGYDILPETASALARSTGITLLESPAEAARADILILAVKPQILEGVLRDLRALPLDCALVISIAAGRDLAFLQTWLGENTPLVRVMPNINAKVGAATSALAANDRVSTELKEEAARIFSSVGSVMELPETLFPVFGAIAGASPAFCYLYIDALARAGVRGGMSRTQALKAAAGTVLGSARMVLESGEHPFALIDQVSSPAGTTVEGICALQSLGFESAVHQAVAAVMRRENSL